MFYLALNHSMSNGLKALSSDVDVVQMGQILFDYGHVDIFVDHCGALDFITVNEPSIPTPGKDFRNVTSVVEDIVVESAHKGYYSGTN